MSEWIEKSLAELVSFQKGRKVETSEHPVEGFEPYLGASALTGDATEYGNARFGVKAEAGDVLMLWDGERSGLVGKGRPGVISSTVAKLASKGEVNGEFLFYVLDSKFEWIQNRRTGTGVPHVPKDIGRIMRVRFPKKDHQQRRIAEILGTVDEVIEQTEALIAKQQQVKAGLMHDLFTRGVTATGQLRPPPAEAPHLYQASPLGPIPKEWEPTTIGACLLGIDAGKSPECPDTPPTADQWGVLKVGAVHPDGLRTAESKVVLNPALRNPAYLVAKDDLLFSRANTSELVGLSCHVTIEPRNLMLSDKTLRLHPHAALMSTRFMFWTLQTPASRRQIENAATGTSGSMKNIGQGSIREIACPRPDLDEQTRITERIDALWTDLAAETAHLAKLRQQKQGLMHDLLTARVPVPA